jgi:hypothetical protein
VQWDNEGPVSRKPQTNPLRKRNREPKLACSKKALEVEAVV